MKLKIAKDKGEAEFALLQRIEELSDQINNYSTSKKDEEIEVELEII